jgi:predicted MFS family arabinose efflux permease
MKRYVLGLLVVVYTFNFIDRQILAILLPAIKAEFGVDDWVLGFLVSAFALFYATLGVPIALLADRFNRRNLIAIAVAVWSGMTALSGLATNVVQLALARVGVGIGEAGFGPPAHSIISDYYPPEQRSTAMGIFTLGISAGIMIAYLAGGWVAQNIGWREAFFIVGVPGLILALIVRFTIDEPVRGMSEQREDDADRPGIIAVARFLSRRKSFIHMAVGSGLASLGGYAVISFFPSFLVRSHAMSLTEIGVYMGFIIGIGGGLGFAGGGYIADKVSRRSKKHALWVVSAATMFAWLFAFPIYLLENRYVVLGLTVIPGEHDLEDLGVAHALAHQLVDVAHAEGPVRHAHRQAVDRDLGHQAGRRDLEVDRVIVQAEPVGECLDAGGVLFELSHRWIGR